MKSNNNTSVFYSPYLLLYTNNPSAFTESGLNIFLFLNEVCYENQTSY
ncbi:hypothetical protein KKH3_38300 [Pectobacterium actinidiae]|nr:hypothetical protein KKH3_38300 [Pectobacterium actinidiae]